MFHDAVSMEQPVQLAKSDNSNVYICILLLFFASILTGLQTVKD